MPPGSTYDLRNCACGSFEAVSSSAGPRASPGFEVCSDEPSSPSRTTSFLPPPHAAASAANKNAFRFMTTQYHRSTGSGVANCLDGTDSRATRFLATGCDTAYSSVMRYATALTRVRAVCLALPDVTERLSHGQPSWF